MTDTISDPTLALAAIRYEPQTEVEMLVERRKSINEFISTNQLSFKAYDDLCEQLEEINMRLEELGE